MTDPSTDMDVSARVAAEAGQLLLRLRESHGPVDDRESADALRKAADRASHELIVARLAEARPGDVVLSEEGADDPVRLDADRVWIVDPLDGTWEYGQGRADFAVHIVLWTRDPSSPAGGVLSAGTVELPAQGLSRQVADAPVPSPGLPVDRPVRVVASRTRPPATLAAAVDVLSARLAEQGFHAGVEVVDVGSVGAKVNEILSGRAEAYLHDTGFYEWDLAAPLAVAKHYGLVCDHWDGDEVDFNLMPPFVKNVFVSHPGIADDLRASLAG